MKTWFQRRRLREQVLLLLFAGLAGLIWLTGAVGRLRHGVTDWRSARTGLAAQQLWLAQRPEIERRSAAAIRDLDPTRTYDVAKLVATITTLATGAGLTVAIDPPVTERTPRFAYHTAKVTLRRASLPQLLRFQDELVRLAPYLNLEAVTLQTDRAAGALNATLQISASQITAAPASGR